MVNFMELKGAHIYETDISLFDKNGLMTPQGYQRAIILTTEKELKRINLSIPEMLEKFGVSWILLSLSVKIEKPIKAGMQLVVNTWHTNKKGIIFRRDFEICSSDGERLALGATFSSLIDLNKRRICMDRSVYDQLNLPEREPLFPAESKTTPQGEFEPCETLEVRPCWIDSLGHVNNFRYGELAFDNLPLEYFEKSNLLARIELFFTGELLLGEKVNISRKNENVIVEIKGEHAENSKPAFFCKLTYNCD